MEPGPTLHLVFRSSKLIALVTAIVLLAANLDNVPDTPELLNSGSGASLQVVHHPVLGCCDTVAVARDGFHPPEPDSQYISDPLVALLPSSSARSLYFAADPSPPAA